MSCGLGVAPRTVLGSGRASCFFASGTASCVLGVAQRTVLGSGTASCGLGVAQFV